MHVLQEITQRNKKGYHVGVFSSCSGDGDVVRAVLRRARKTNTIAIIESTSNQVNQFGGYTQRTPEQFASYVRQIAREEGLSWDAVILGGDHLGPLPWTDLAEQEAMQNACDLVVAYINAGFTKIHLDTSMRVASDSPDEPFHVEICARRGALMCAAAEEAYQKLENKKEKPVYIIGSEVPVPGGDFSQELGEVTQPEACQATIAAYQKAFIEHGLNDVFSRVVGLVVQTGVEFFERNIDEYDRRQTADLIKATRKLPVVLEGHSTDYQLKSNLRCMCEDGIAILKVGPEFTFALREALFDLEHIEKELYAKRPEEWSNFRQILEEAMLEDPRYWKDYYTGDEEDLRISRIYSFYDRSRYYLPHKKVNAAREKLVKNLTDKKIPECMLSQYFPNQYMRVRNGKIKNYPLDIILDRIGDRIDAYLEATGNNGFPEGFLGQ